MLYTKELAENLKKAVSQVELKQEMDDDFTFEVIATTEDQDRDNEVVKVEGWDTRNWEKNPVILANHKYTIENIVGKGLEFYTENGVKKLKGVFSKTNPMAKLAKNLYDEGMLKTVSVGFIPLERSEQDRRIIEKAELLEVSFVAVPANPNAVSLDDKVFAEAKEKGLIKEVDKAMSEDEINEVYDKYKAAVNMSYSQLKAWSETECSKQASNSRQPITRNLKLLDTNKADWTESDAKEANKTISFIARMKENLGGDNIVTLEDGTECGTKAYISLKNWAYDADKKSKAQKVDKEDAENELCAESCNDAQESEKFVHEEIEDLRSEISELKDMIKSLADDKADNEIDKQAADVKAKKEILQSINKATATALHNLKKL